MLSDSKIVALTATTKPDLAKKFYKENLGLALLTEDDFALVFDANGIMLRMQKVREHAPSPITVLGWEVAKLSLKVDELLTTGLVFERFEGLEQDKRGIWKSPSGAQVAWFKDPDGNILSLTQL